MPASSTSSDTGGGSVGTTLKPASTSLRKMICAAAFRVGDLEGFFAEQVGQNVLSSELAAHRAPPRRVSI